MSTLPDGPGAKGCFLGLQQPEKPRISIVPVPFEATTSFQQGTSAGPAALLEASRYIEGYDVETECELFHIGIETRPEVRAKEFATLSKILRAECEQLADQGRFVVTIGGEHAISSIPIAVQAERYGSLSVLQFDAHTDLRDQYEGNRHSHACVMARAKEHENVSNIVAVGIRALDKSELQQADRKDVFFDHEVQDLNSGWIDRVIERLEEHVYVSFDVDVFGTDLMPATGTPEPGGMNWFQALSLLHAVCNSRTVVGFDIVELMPLEGLRAPEFLAARLVYKFLNYRFAKEVAR